MFKVTWNVLILEIILVPSRYFILSRNVTWCLDKIVVHKFNNLNVSKSGFVDSKYIKDWIFYLIHYKQKINYIYLCAEPKPTCCNTVINAANFGYHLKQNKNWFFKLPRTDNRNFLKNNWRVKFDTLGFYFVILQNQHLTSKFMSLIQHT